MIPALMDNAGMQPSKRAAVAEALSAIDALAAEHGFSRRREGRGYDRVQSTEVTSYLGLQVVQGRLPRDFSVDVQGSIRLASVAELCCSLFGRDPAIATIGGPLWRFTSRTDASSSYHIRVADPLNPQLERLDADIASFARFAAGVESYRALARRRLERIAGLRRNFAEGLGETYAYTVPEVAAVLHALNGDTAAAAAAIDLAAASPAKRVTVERVEALRAFVTSGPHPGATG